MLFEGWAALTGAELATLVFKDVFGKLAQATLEDYVKDFFKDSIKSGVVGIQRRQALQVGMAEAIAALTQLFEKELRFRRVDSAIFEQEYMFQENPRKIALASLLSQAPKEAQVISLLRDRAQHDSNEQFRKWAQQQLKRLAIK